MSCDVTAYRRSVDVLASTDENYLSRERLIEINPSRLSAREITIMPTPGIAKIIASSAQLRPGLGVIGTSIMEISKTAAPRTIPITPTINTIFANTPRLMQNGRSLCTAFA